MRADKFNPLASLVTWVIVILMVFPLIWMVLTSIKPEGEVFVRIPSILPHVPTLENYRALFGHSETLMQLRNSLITVVTVVGLQLGGLIAGIVTVEVVFNIPGIGQLTLDSVYQRDYPTLQGAVLLTAAAYIIVNLLTDVCYTLINPRLRVSVARGTA